MILESRIKNLCDKLRSSKKFKPADYYESLLNRTKNSSNRDKKNAIQEIISSGKLSDMANFSIEEDKLLDLVYEEAKKLKK